MSDSKTSYAKPIVGGGVKKVLYTLNTATRIGLLNSAKALTSKNACKACGLGMGGQRGGMTNEKDEFPSVCNKSIQAQSTDIQPPIPVEVFEHPLKEFQKLSAKEIEALGRLNTPLHKLAGSDQYRPIDWQEALDIVARAFAAVSPDKSFFYSSGRSSNEAGFVLQLLARLYGTNNVNNCSYYCHQATGVGLNNTIGTGTSTVELNDLAKSDCIFVIGANPASNHPRFIHQLKNCRDRGGEVVVVNPAREPGLVKFAVPKSPKSMLKGGDLIASQYRQPNIGSDVWFLNGVAKALFESEQIDEPFIERYTNNFSAFREQIFALDWPSIESNTGLTRAEIEETASVYANADNAVFAWGMGVTHHEHGVENVEAISNLALMRGMIGKPGAGLLPLRGHSNVQGIGTIGVKPVLSEDVFAAMEAHFGIKLPQAKGMDTLACLEAADAGDIQAALIMGGNLFSATPNSEWARQAFEKIGFKCYMTTTLNKGHVTGVDSGEAIILPVSARDEEPQATTQESMFNFVRLSDGGIIRLDNIKAESDILCELAQRLVPDCPIDFEAFKNHDTIRESIAKTVSGLAELKDISVAKREFHVANRLLHTPQFKTPDGKARFVPVTASLDRKQGFPFTLMSIRSEGQFNSIIYEERDTYRGTETRWSVLMNEQDMTELNLVDNATVTIESEVGEMRDVYVRSFAVARGNIMAYYPEANVLIGLTRDPRSQTPAFKSVAVRLVVGERAD